MSYKILRVALGSIFFASGISKLANFSSFINTVSTIVGDMSDLPVVVGLYVVIFELLLGTSVIVGLKPNVSLQLMLFAILIFTMVTTVRIIREGPVDCGCFVSIVSNESPLIYFFRNFLIVGVIIFLMNHPTRLIIRRYFPCLRRSWL
ncbi:MAG: DoxX family protein [Candidatus Kryptoniota bacterium]